MNNFSNVFNLLHPKLLEVIINEGYVEPTPIQKIAIPLILKGLNVIITAPTGSGKTEAVMFPIFSKILENLNTGKTEGIQVLYITPMRALNRDIYVRMKNIAEKLGIIIDVRHGDTPRSVRRKQTERPPHVLITTPETFQFVLINRKLRRALTEVWCVVVDEIHELINDKRGIQLSISLERLAELCRNFQRIGLSATIGNTELVLKFLCNENKGKVISASTFKEIEITVHRPLPETKHYGENLPEVEARLRFITNYAKQHRSILIFVNTRDTAELLGSKLSKSNNLAVGVYHGSLSREEREELERKLRKGEIKAIVSTSSLELGIDVGTIDAIVQYMSPRQVTRLVQRVGRSGHKFGEKSIGIIITTDLDDTLEAIIIASKAISQELEKEVEYHENALDVLAHQIVGIVLDKRIDNNIVKIEDIYNIVKRAHPYRRLSMDKFMRIINFLKERGLIGIDNDKVYPRRGSLKYYIDNASTIPDEIKYSAIDIISNKCVGELDEEFTSTIDLNSKIILAGKVWKIVNIDSDNKRVYLEPCVDISGAIPSWVGEEIPVPFEIAQEVAKLKINLKRKYYRDEIAKELERYCNVTKDTVKFIRNEYSKLIESNVHVPELGEVYIEYCGKNIVIHSHLGSKGNEALGIYLSRYLSRDKGVSIGYRADPYRVLLTAPIPINPDDLIRALSENRENVLNILIEGIEYSKLFRYRFIHVARRFGIISKEALSSMSADRFDRLIRTYRDTPVYEETIREIITDKLDIKHLLELIEDIKRGSKKLNIVKLKEFTLLSLPIVNSSNRIDFTIDGVPKSLIVEMIKRRIEEKSITLICLRCGWHINVKIKYVGDTACLRCGYRTVSMLKYEDINTVLKILEKVRRKRSLSADEKKLWDTLRYRALILQQYGKYGLIALAAHGVGTTSAIKKILTKASTEEELYLHILEVEKEYLRTRKFWE